MCDQDDSGMQGYWGNMAHDPVDIRDSRDWFLVRVCEEYVLVIGKNTVHHRDRFCIYKFYVQCGSACG